MSGGNSSIFYANLGASLAPLIPALQFLQSILSSLWLFHGELSIHISYDIIKVYIHIT